MGDEKKTKSKSESEPLAVMELFGYALAMMSFLFLVTILTINYVMGDFSELQVRLIIATSMWTITFLIIGFIGGNLK